MSSHSGGAEQQPLAIPTGTPTMNSGRKNTKKNLFKVAGNRQLARQVLSKTGIGATAIIAAPRPWFSDAKTPQGEPDTKDLIVTPDRFAVAQAEIFGPDLMDTDTEADDEMKNWFKRFDIDGDGEINNDEFADAINMMHGNCLPKDVLEDMFAELDVDGDGSVSIEEFSVLIGPLRQKIDKFEVTDDELRDAFNAFDRNRDGSLDAQELCEVLKDFGVELSQDDLVRVMEEVDDDHDGTVDQDEFAKMIRHQ
eukprot:SAG22_NODE_4413_length_1278_cov_0.976251_1_plen_251_part_01